MPEVKARDLAAQLKQAVPAAALIAGDEPLLVEEAVEAVFAAFQAAGPEPERVHRLLETGFDWGALEAELAAGSLFASRKRVWVRGTGWRLGKEGAAFLARYLARPDPEVCLVLSGPRLDREQRKAAWFRAVEAAGWVVLLWPPAAHELPGWIAGRLRAAGFAPQEEACRLLAAGAEGNLLAAHQAVERLKLMRPEGAVIDMEAARSAGVNASRFDGFDLAHAVLVGDGRRVSRVLQALRAEGEAIPAIAGALGFEFRRLLDLVAARASGEAVETRLRALRLGERQLAAVRRALLRLPSVEAWQGARQLLAVVDRQSKGAGALVGSGAEALAWLELERGLLALCGPANPAAPAKTTGSQGLVQ